MSKLQAIKSFVPSPKYNEQDEQYYILRRLYAEHELDLVMTCPACPEQYDVFYKGQDVAYFRLRHGHFTADFLNRTIFEAEPVGDGMFMTDERMSYLTQAMDLILKELQEIAVIA